MNESFAFQGYSFNNQIVCVINGEDICQMNLTGQQTPKAVIVLYFVLHLS